MTAKHNEATTASQKEGGEVHLVYAVRLAYLWLFRRLWLKDYIENGVNRSSIDAGRLKLLEYKSWCATLLVQFSNWSILKSEHLKSAKSMSHLKLRFRTASEMQSSTGCEFRTAGFDSL